MKTRLNTHARHCLMDLARSLIRCPDTDKREAEAFDIAAVLVRNEVENVFPPKDMKILEKYGQAGIDDCIRITGQGINMTLFRFKDGTGPLSISCKTFLVSDETAAAVIRWENALKDHQEAIKAKVEDYRALVNSSRYFEDVTDIWPEAESVRDEIGTNALTVISPDLIKRIKADVGTRWQPSLG
jgi:hypothetical protein